MEDYVSSDSEYNFGDIDDDRDYLDGVDDALEDSETERQWLDENNSSCKVITKDSLTAAQRNDMQRVMDLLSLKEHHARTLLIHYRWDVEKVFVVFVERGKDQLYTEAGVTIVEHNNLSLLQSSSEVICDICMEEVLANETTTMDCGHCFCNDCWTKYFIVQINEGQSRRITCMAHKCNAICDEGKIRSLVSAKHQELAEKFDRFLLESYIEDNNRVKWCPSVPHCGNAIRIDYDKYCEVECACGMQFCFGCSLEVHSPCSCLMWELWTRKCVDESETVNWMTIHTKFCPNCHKPVEKNGGCNQVRCICGQYFCWLCGGPTGGAHTWDSIDGHSCGRYAKDTESKIESAKKYLWRYNHYYNRYKAHGDSLKAEMQLKEKIYAKMSNLEAKESACKDFSWMSDGLCRLSSSRRVLSYSYPFAYYMFDPDLFKMTDEEREIKQNLFEVQQQQLEANIEKLSMSLEEPIDEYDEKKVEETRIKIIALSKITDKLCRKLCECIEIDLLGQQSAFHIIAPYKSKGVEKASEYS